MSSRLSMTDSDLDNADEKSSFLESGNSKFSQRRLCSTRQISAWKWKLACCVLLFLQLVTCVYIYARDGGQHQGRWLPSELYSARDTIKYHDILFTSGIEERPDGQMYLNLPDDEPAYVGKPSKSIDAAWANLTLATEIWVDGDDARGVTNRSISSDNGWLVSLDVYHSLHCVNLARKGLDWDYYYGDQPGQEPVNYLTKEHIYHCLEHLRQVVMCHSDLTPMRFRWSSIKEGRGMPVWDEPHTCRDFGRVREWAEARKRDFPSSHAGHAGHTGHQ